VRILETFPTKVAMVSIYSWNQKWIIKFESGDFEQTYKIPADEIANKELLKEKILNHPNFLLSIQKRMDEMNQSAKEVFLK
jgi:hypothetical protein